MTDVVTFLCVAEGSRLRVRITSPGYMPGANCQFPRAIREAGAVYHAPAAAVALARSGERYFYRVRAAAIAAGAPAEGAAAGPGADGSGATRAGADADLVARVRGMRVYGEGDAPECLICMSAVSTRVFYPCGHHCACDACIAALRRAAPPRGLPLCPLCRTPIQEAVDRALIT